MVTPYAGMNRIRFHGCDLSAATRGAPRSTTNVLGCSDSRWIGVKECRTLVANPAKGVFDVLNDLRELRFGREAIVDRDERVVALAAGIEEPARNAFAMAVDQRAAMNPNDDRLTLLGFVAMNIDLDLQIADGLIGVRHLFPFRAGLRPK